MNANDVRKMFYAMDESECARTWRDYCNERDAQGTNNGQVDEEGSAADNAWHYSHPGPELSEEVDCPYCMGDGCTLDGFNELIECPLCNGAKVVDPYTLPAEWQEYIGLVP